MEWRDRFMNIERTGIILRTEMYLYWKGKSGGYARALVNSVYVLW